MVVALIIAVPPAFAVTFPFLSTTATFLLEVVHVTLLFAASSGRTVAVRVNVSPLTTVLDATSNLIPVASGALTVTVHVAVLPFAVVAVIVAVPTALAVTLP